MGADHGGDAGAGGGLPPLIHILAYFVTQVGVTEKLVDHTCQVGKNASLSSSYCQAQFQLASLVPVQVGTEICLIISVTAAHPPIHPGKYI